MCVVAAGRLAWRAPLIPLYVSKEISPFSPALCLRLLSHHPSANSLQDNLAWEGYQDYYPILINWCLRQSQPGFRAAFGGALCDPNLTLSPPRDLSQNCPAGCGISRHRNPSGRYSFHLLEHKHPLGLPARGSHPSPPLDGASLPSLVIRPPPCSGSRANLITSLFTAFAGNLGRLKSSKADNDLQPTSPQRAHSFVHNFALPSRAPQNGNHQEVGIHKDPIPVLCRGAHRKGSDSSQQGSQLS